MPRKILLISPKSPPYGGMALQAETLERMLTCDGHLVHFVPSNLPFPKALRFVDRIRGIRPFIRSALMCVTLWRKIRQTEVVHILAASWLYFFLVVAPAVFVGRTFRKRVIINYRSGNGRQFFRAMRWLVSPIFALADAVTAPSDFLAQAIREQFKISVLIVPNIVNFSAFRYRQRKVFQPRMLVSRHLEKIYDVESVIRAFRALQEHHPKAVLYIAGSGSQQEYLHRLVAGWQLEGVHFLGHVPHRELTAVYDNCDILLNGSIVDNFPGSLLEASASGLAIVSTNAGGIPFMYENRKNAILVKPGDWRGLASGVESILRDPSLGEKLTLAALQVCRQCDWENVRQSLYVSYGFTIASASNFQGGYLGCHTNAPQQEL